MRGVSIAISAVRLSGADSITQILATWSQQSVTRCHKRVDQMWLCTTPALKHKGKSERKLAASIDSSGNAGWCLALLAHNRQ
eukprot:15205-Heterococcus_DN1.PRE.2